MADNINYLLGAPTYTNEKQQRVATGEGAYGQMEDYMQQYLNRGDWRMAMDQGASSPYGPLQHRDASGVWSDWTDPIVGYDPRQDANTLDSNERRRFNQGFLQGNTGTDLRGDNLQTVAVQNGWKEPPRNNKTTLMSVLRDIAPGVGMVLGGGMLANSLLGAPGLANTGFVDTLGEWPTVGPGTGTPDIGAVTQGPIPSSEYVDTLGDWPTHNMVDPNYVDTLGDWPTTTQQPSAWDFGPGNFRDNGWDFGPGNINDVGVTSNITPGSTLSGNLSRVLESLGGGGNSLAKALGLGDTASSLLGLGTKLLSGLDLVRRNRQALNTNDQRLRDSKDATPLSATSFNMLRPTALRRAKGGLAQCAECGGMGGQSAPRYVQGGTSGQSDKIPAMLSDGEYVFDADSVAALGDGNNAAGAAALDQMRQNIRKHKRSAPAHKIPPKAKQPEHYLKGAK